MMANAKLSLEEKIKMAKEELNRAEKAENYYGIPLKLLQIRFLAKTKMTTPDKGNIELEPVRWFCEDENANSVVIETYTMACRSFAEKLIEVFDGQMDFREIAQETEALKIIFSGQITKTHKDDGKLSPTVSLV